MKLSEAWNNLETLFDGYTIVKEIFLNRFFYMELKYDIDYTKHFLTYYLKTNMHALKNFELLNELSNSLNIDRLQSTSNTQTNSTNESNNSNKEIYSGFNVEGEFKKNIVEANNTNNTNVSTNSKENPLNFYKKFSDLKNINLIDPFINSCTTLFVAFFPVNI